MTTTAPTTTDGAPSAAASAGGTTESSQAVESDFLERARRDPAWAAEQIASFQSAADKAKSAEEKANQALNGIGTRTREYVEKFGGDTVDMSLNAYAALRSSEAFGALIQEFERTGKLPASTGSASNVDDDEYLTPEDEKIKALTDTVDSLKRSVGDQALVTANEHLTKHMQRVASELEFTDADKEVMFATAKKQFAQWSTLGEKGEEAMKAVMGPGGFDTVRGIMLSKVSGEALRAAAVNVNLRKQKGLNSLSSGVPSSAASTGREKPVFKTAMEAATWAADNPDLNESR